MSVNLDLVRSIYADWQRGDWSSSVWAAEEIEFVATEGPWAGSVTGKRAMARTWREWLEAWKDTRARPDGFRELRDGEVLALHTWSARGKLSGLEVERMEAKSAVLFHIVSGKVTKLVAYQDREQAFADLNLSAQDVAPD